MKLEQLKQLEAAYTEMQVLRASEPGAQSRPIASVAEAGTQSQSPHSRSNEAIGSAGRTLDAAAATESVDEVEDESSVPPSPAPPPRPRPPKNYRYVPVVFLLFYNQISSPSCSVENSLQCLYDANWCSKESQLTT